MWIVLNPDIGMWYDIEKCPVRVVGGVLSCPVLCKR